MSVDQQVWLGAFDPDSLCACRSMAYGTWLDWLNARASSRGLRTGHDQPLRFVPQAALPEGRAYEAHIAETGEVPTRDNLHDRFNALLWLHMPISKAALNRIQAEAISAAGGVGPVRGRLRDWATLLDENGLLLVDRGRALETLLDHHDWSSLFCDHAERWSQEWHVFPLGHALLEKLERPFKSITAHARVLQAHADGPANGADWTWLDRTFVADLLVAAAAQEGPARLSPLPVMGLPGWSPDQAAPGFYADAQVFRPPRS